MSEQQVQYSVPTPDEQISCGTCPTCGGPAQFIEGGTVRHVDLSCGRIRSLKERLMKLINSESASDPLDAAVADYKDRTDS